MVINPSNTDEISSQIKSINSQLIIITSNIGSCENINEAFFLSVESAVCYSGFEGMFNMWILQFAIGGLLFLGIIAIYHHHLHIRRLIFRVLSRINSLTSSLIRITHSLAYLISFTHSLIHSLTHLSDVSCELRVQL